jgi:hypothetical protein
MGQAKADRENDLMRGFFCQPSAFNGAVQPEESFFERANRECL